VSDHESGFVNAFIVREKRQRIGALLASARRRREALDRLNHGGDLNLALGTVIPPAERTPNGVERLLRQRRAVGTCHVIADGLKADGQELPLREALALAAAHEWAVALSCVPGRLAFYKEEAPGDWWILERT
jgi:hypothetical protein